MEVYTLSGISGKAERKAKKAARKEKRADKKDARKEKRAEKKAKGKGVLRSALKVVKKGGLAPSRAAFLGLIELNAHGLATSLSEAIQKDSAKVKKTWEKLGGTFSQLEKTVGNGAKRKAILGFDEQIGSVAAVATAITASAPIIAAVVPLLKQIGIKNKKLDEVNASASKTYEETTGKSAIDAAKEMIDPSSKDDEGGTNYLLWGTIGLATAGLLYAISSGGKKGKRK